MQVLEALISFLMFLLIFSSLYIHYYQRDVSLYKAMLEEDVNNVFYNLGGMDNPIVAVSELREQGICVDYDEENKYLKNVRTC